MSAAQDPQGQWSITDTPDGWQLDLRFRVPLQPLLRLYVRDNIAVGQLFIPMMFVLCFTCAMALGVFFAGTSLLRWLFFLPIAPFVAAIGTALLWPLRYAKGGGMLLEHSHLRYFESRRRQRLESIAGRIDVDGIGTFETQCLLSLEPRELDPDLQRYTLVFRGHTVEAPLFGWPGFTLDTVTQIQRVILSRLGTEER